MDRPSLEIFLKGINDRLDSGITESAEEQARYALNRSKSLEDPKLTSKAYRILADLNFMKRDLVQSEKYTRKALQQCDIAFDTLTCMGMHSLMGAILSYQSRYAEALEHFDEALNISLSAGLTDQSIKIRFNISSVQADMGNYEKALENLLECKTYFESRGEEESVALVYNNLGLLYLNNLNKPEKALSHFREAHEIYSRYANPFNRARALSNLGLAYTAVGAYDSAKTVLLKSVDLRKNLQDQGNLAFAYHGLGDLMNRTGSFEEAVDYMHKSRTLSIKHGLDEGIYYAGTGLGLAYDSLGNFTEAEHYFQEAWEHARQSGNPEFLVSSMAHLYRHYKQQGATHKALESLEKLQSYHHTRDSILQSEKLNRLEMLYNSELTQKENELLRLKQQKQLTAIHKEKKLNAVLYAVALVMLLMLIFLGLSYQQRNKMLVKLKEQKQKLESQKHELNEVNDSKNRLFSVISHDLRGPISSVVSYLDVLGFQMDQSDPMAPLVADLQHETRTTLHTLEDLLAWSRIQMSGISRQPVDFDLNRLTTQVMNLFQAGAQHKNITLTFIADSDHCPVNADEQQIKMVLRNILSNAIKFSPADAEVVLSTKTENGQALLEVKDQGKGISDEELQKIKDPQEYYTSAGTHNEKGTGVGLLLTFQYLQMNEGSLEFEANQPAGTIATIRLKAAQTAAVTLS